MLKTAVSTIYNISFEREKFIDFYKGKSFHNLSEMLDKIGGISDLEFDGMSVANIWLTLDKEADNEETWSEIEKVFKKVKLVE